MTESIQALLASYQVRKTFSQKEAFRSWLKPILQQLGYELEEHCYSKKGRNLIVGDVSKANVILTAHYDTQPISPIPIVFGVSNLLAFILTQLIQVVMICLPVFVAAFGVGYVTKDVVLAGNVAMLVAAALFLQMMVGIANPNTANDNTSGVTVLLAIMEQLPREQREKVCFVFFDQEELGMIGSGAFKKRYKHELQGKSLINFDCISNGDYLFFIEDKPFQQRNGSRLADSIKHIQPTTAKQLLIGPAKKHIYTSDQMIFKDTVGVAAFNKSPYIGYYLHRIHSRKDTVFQWENIEVISRVMVMFIQAIE